jgi:WhiB family redox-sensing transcriptional regulator
MTRRGPKGGNPYGHKQQCRCTPECTEHARQFDRQRAARRRAQFRHDGYVMHHGKPARPSTQPTGVQHGTVRSAANGCTCDRCAEHHGTKSAYVGGCRCDLCKQASAKWQADYRARRLSANGVRLPRWPPDPIPQPVKPAPERLFERADWMVWAECKHLDSAIFFPERHEDGRLAKQICADCPVRVLCLNYALDNREQFGIWGGKSVQERRRILRERAA